MSFAEVEEEGQQTNADLLRMEFGWREVSSGLGRILLGNFIVIGGTALCVGLVVYAIFNMAGGKAQDQVPKLGYVWAFYIGFSALSLVWLFGYGMIVTGQWRCLMNAPERRGAKWLMFACMTGLLMGPALNVAAGATGLDKGPDYRRGPAGFVRVKFSPTARKMQTASGVLGFSSYIFFILFLRAVARCFEDRARLAHVTFYLLVSSVLIAATLYVAMADPKLLTNPQVLLGLGVGWVVAFIWYLCLVGVMRSCIAQGMSQVRSPLDTPLEAEQ
jgi:hypothetical protein